MGRRLEKYTRETISMKIKCDYCNSMIDETEESCPNCGAVLSGVNRFASGQPQTIEQLEQWYQDHHLPPEEVTRFFIGKDIKEPRAFGIFKAGSGDFIVYKNKSNGERVLRYCGSDEAYAVNELYQRLKAEIAEQKENQKKRAIETEKRRKKEKWQNRNAGCLFGCLAIGGGIFAITFAVCIIFAVIAYINDDSPAEGYYTYNGSNYYYQDSSWYAYDAEEDNWDEMEDSSSLSEITKDNQENYSMNRESHEGELFEDSEWYKSYSSSSDSSDDDYDSDDWDNDSDWDSNDSWDSGSTDWDSDW